MANRHQTLTLRNDLAEIARLVEFLDAFCKPMEPSEDDLLALHLALEETVTNVINHGYRDGRPHSFTVGLTADRDRRVTAVVTDDAPAYDPLARPPVDTSLPAEQRPVGGLGIHLVKNMMHAVRYERRGDKNILTLERTIGRTP
jgi:serine/threonine-protein kinase RsbW